MELNIVGVGTGCMRPFDSGVVRFRGRVESASKSSLLPFPEATQHIQATSFTPEKGQRWIGCPVSTGFGSRRRHRIELL